MKKDQRIEILVDENAELRKENKNLRLIQETNEKQIQNDIKERDELREEIKNLKEEVKKRKMVADENGTHYDMLEEENKKLKFDIEARKKMKKAREEKISFLEECLDNKEKLNEEYRVKLDKYKKYYDRDKEELMESCYALAKENDRLKSDLGECECSFGFENDEVGYWKREYKRLKKWIKDHCNGYGNLFPEDLEKAK